jgi:hypothetical protein
MSFLYKSLSLLLASTIVSVALVAQNLYPSGDQPEGNRSITNQSKRERLQKLKREIDAEIGTPRADKLTQCKHIGFGAKPCGGHWRYLVYSTAQTDEARLKQLVGDYNALEKQINEEEGLASDCSMVMEPELALEGGVCVSKQK